MRAVYERRIAPGARVAAVAKEGLSLRGAFAVYGAAAGKFQFAGRPEWHIRRPRAGSACVRRRALGHKCRRAETSRWSARQSAADGERGLISRKSTRRFAMEVPGNRTAGGSDSVLSTGPCRSPIVSLAETRAPILSVHAKSLIILAIPAGFEPATLCLEGRCSIQLSYGTSPSRAAGRQSDVTACLYMDFLPGV